MDPGGMEREEENRETGRERKKQLQGPERKTKPGRERAGDEGWRWCVCVCEGA